MSTGQDPIEDFEMKLDLAKLQAGEKRFADAYWTLLAAYENLIEQHNEVINDLIELRKKVFCSDAQ